MPVVKRAFTYVFSHGGSVDVPAGAPLERNYFDGGYWVCPSAFPKDSIAHHDANHYGIRVPGSNATEAL